MTITEPRPDLVGQLLFQFEELVTRSGEMLVEVHFGAAAPEEVREEGPDDSTHGVEG